MEGEKKRKRSEDEEAGGRRRKESEEKAEVVPTDEEVDEFFAILQRMQVAVKYFKKGSSNKLATMGRWATALEAEILAGVDPTDDVVVKAAGERVCGVLKKKGSLDLNAAPDAESNSLSF